MTVARRGMRGARGWGHRRHRGRRLERGAKSPARLREAAKDGLDRRAARRPHARAPTPGLRAGPAPEPPGTRALGCRLPPSEEQEKIRAAGHRNFLPSAARVRRGGPLGWGRAGSRGPSQAAPSPVLSPGGQSQQHDGRTSTNPRMRSRGPAPTTPAVSSGPGLWAAAPRGPGISLHLAGRRFTTKSPRKLPSQ